MSGAISALSWVLALSEDNTTKMKAEVEAKLKKIVLEVGKNFNRYAED